MIRSCKLSLKFTNKEKLRNLRMFLAEYRRVMGELIDVLWDNDKHPKFVSMGAFDGITTWLTARAKQCVGKQAIAIIRGTLKKHQQRMYVRDRLRSEGKCTKHLDKFIRPSKPILDNVPAELDERFVEVNDSRVDGFNLWAKFGSFGNRISVMVPLKKTMIYNRWCELRHGVRKHGCRLDDNTMTLCFECEPRHNTSKRTIGCDIGITSCLSLSNGVQIKSCKHGHTLSSIQGQLSLRTKGSRGFRRAQTHRTNFINWCVNQLRTQNVGSLVIEDIRDLRKGKNTGRFLSHFTYAKLLRKLELFCEDNDVRLTRVNPAYTSQKCSRCGEVKAQSRNGERFCCVSCGYMMNADVNAAMNILTSL
jgi:putative transposase